MNEANHLHFVGTLKKAPYFGDKGWANCILEVPKEGTTFKEWVPLYFPSGIAPQLKTLALTDVLVVVGEWDTKKDKTVQVKVLGVEVKKGFAPAENEGTEIQDSEIPW